MDFPGGVSGKELTCQCRKHKKHGFSPWVRKIPCRRAWQPTLVFLPEESCRHTSLVGYSPWKQLSTAPPIHSPSPFNRDFQGYTSTTVMASTTYTDQYLLCCKIQCALVTPHFSCHLGTFTHLIIWKTITCQCGRPRFNPGSGRSPAGGHGNPFQYSCLENPMD